jgi:tRNA nucleotidyltransferase/poly(A) polymerase
MTPQIHQVSMERIQGEITRILTEGQARTGFQMLHDSGLLREVLPEIRWNEYIAECLCMLARRRLRFRNGRAFERSAVAGGGTHHGAAQVLPAEIITPPVWLPASRNSVPCNR